jgi:TetR/AcrR family transcriptional repressor of nem operon
LQGALLVKRATCDAAQLRDLITVMKLQLSPGA